MHSRLRPSPAMVLALIALFVSLGGTAAALSGSNTVFSDDIVDNQVFSADVRNDTLAGGGLGAADLGPGSVGTSEVAANSLGAGDLASNSVGTSEIAAGAVGTNDVSGSIPTVNVTNSTSLSILPPPFAATVLAFNTERYDTANLHNSTNNSRLTAPVKGIYVVTARVVWEPDSSGSRFLYVRKNGGAPFASDTRPGVGDAAQSVTTQVKLAAGDYLEALATQTSGSGPDLDADGAEFSMSWVAPGP
jgi:hypothetical protein